MVQTRQGTMIGPSAPGLAMRQRPLRSPQRKPYAPPALGVPIAPIARASTSTRSFKEWVLRVADVLFVCCLVGGLVLSFNSDAAIRAAASPPSTAVSWQWRPFGRLPWPS